MRIVLCVAYQKQVYRKGQSLGRTLDGFCIKLWATR